MTAGIDRLPVQEPCCALPTFQPEALQNAQAPVEDGGFFVRSENRIPGLGPLVTPVDDFSGIPLPLSPAYMENRPSRYRPDDHHPWHDRLHPELQSLSGYALRGSRVQLANYDAHYIDYHTRAFRGPIIPTDELSQRRAIVLAAAGYVPEKAISFTERGKPELVPLAKRARQKLWRDGLIRVERPQAVRDYLFSLLLSQDLSDVKEATIDEFLNTENNARKWELGNELLGRSARKVAEPINANYAQAYKLHLLPYDRARTASRFVLSAAIMHRYRGRLYAQLGERLAS